MYHLIKAWLDAEGGTYGWHMAIHAIASQQEILALEASKGLLRSISARNFNKA